MSKTYFLPHQGRQILLMDFSNVVDVEEGLQRLDQAKQIVAEQPKKSLLILTDISGSMFDRRAVKALAELAKHDEPYVIASALVGATGLRSIVLSTVSKLTGRSFKLCKTRAEGLDWLAKQ